MRDYAWHKYIFITFCVISYVSIAIETKINEHLTVAVRLHPNFTSYSWTASETIEMLYLKIIHHCGTDIELKNPSNYK